jgi:hypothetical protein
VSQPNPSPTYVGEHVQIGTGKGGMKPLAQNGRVIVGNGMLQLIGTQGQVLDQAPVGEVTTAKSRMTMGGVTWVTLGDRRYSVSIGAGGLMLLGGLARIIKGSSGGKKFTAALAAEQARAGAR